MIIEVQQVDFVLFGGEVQLCSFQRVSSKGDLHGRGRHVLRCCAAISDFCCTITASHAANSTRWQLPLEVGHGSCYSARSAMQCGQTYKILSSSGFGTSCSYSCSAYANSSVLNWRPDFRSKSEAKRSSCTFQMWFVVFFTHLFAFECLFRLQIARIPFTQSSLQSSWSSRGCT